MSGELNEQIRLDEIQHWLSMTTEEFDEWNYDGEELTIILKGRIIESYDNETIGDFLGIHN
jgi:hypothetical protein